jgi:hypothetical protein
VAPLVAFGVFQSLSGATPTPQAASGVAAAHAEGGVVPGYWEEDRTAHRAPAGVAVARTEGRPDKGPGTTRPVKAHAHASPTEGSNGPGVTGAAAAGGSRPDKIVLCHPTPADAQPGVTLDVSPHALAGLADDARGAC